MNFLNYIKIFESSYIKSIFTNLVSIALFTTLFLLVNKFIKIQIIAFIKNNRVHKNSKRNFIKLLLHYSVVKSFFYLLPGIICLVTFDYVKNILDINQNLSLLMAKAIRTYLIITAAPFLSKILDLVEYKYYKMTKTNKDVSIKSLIQSCKILFFAISAILCLAVITGNSAVKIITGFGAFGALLTYIFQDSIKSFFACMQISAYNLVKVGDWIEVPGTKACGHVTNISLNIIQVQNFDKSLVTFPVLHLVNNGLINWRNMVSLGKRRIKRSFCIDIRTVKFCNDDFINSILKDPVISSNINEDIIKTSQTNLEMFRKYAFEYLNNNSNISDMMLLVRQLEQKNLGLPVEIYAFTNTAVWKEYEAIQNHIMEHIIAVLPRFELEIASYSL